MALFLAAVVVIVDHPHCQLCRKEGHYTSSCPNLSTFAQHGPVLDANLAQAFYSQCHVSENSLDWYVDSGATTHMTSTLNGLSFSTPYLGPDRVTFRNGNSLPVLYTGKSCINNRLPLLDVFDGFWS